MKLEPIAEALEVGGIGTRGTSIFIHRMPEKVTAGILLLSRLTGTPIDREIPGLRKTSFQVIVRGRDYANGYNLAEQISALLTIEGGMLGDINIHWILPKHEPVVYPVSKGDLLEISVNFEAVYVAT